MANKTHADRLVQLDTCAVSDAMDKLKLNGVIYGILPLTSGRKICGKLITILLDWADKDRLVGSKAHLGAKAIDAGTSENVLLVSQPSMEIAGWGGILSQAASLKGIKGVIVDGAVRDIDESRAIDFPVFGKAPVPVTARGRIIEIGTNVPLTVGNIKVQPGDYAIADGSGVVIIPSDRITEVLKVAESLSKRESMIVEEIRKGRPVAEVMNLKYENMLL